MYTVHVYVYILSSVWSLFGENGYTFIHMYLHLELSMRVTIDFKNFKKIKKLCESVS